MKLTINLKNLVKDFFNALFSKKGRTSRIQFFLQFILFLGVFSFIFFSILFLLAMPLEIPINSWLNKLDTILTIVILLILILSIGLFVHSLCAILLKRLHDLDKGRFIVFLFFIPYLSPFIFVYLLSYKGSNRINLYGENPLKKNNFIENRNSLILWLIFFITLILLNINLYTETYLEYKNIIYAFQYELEHGLPPGYVY